MVTKVKNHTKKCWSCGEVTMINKGDYYQCSECEATWNSLPTLGEFQGLVTEFNPQDGRRKYKPKMMLGKVKGGKPLPKLYRPTEKGYGKIRRT